MDFLRGIIMRSENLYTRIAPENWIRREIFSLRVASNLIRTNPRIEVTVRNRIKDYKIT